MKSVFLCCNRLPCMFAGGHPTPCTEVQIQHDIVSNRSEWRLRSRSHSIMTLHPRPFLSGNICIYSRVPSRVVLGHFRLRYLKKKLFPLYGRRCMRFSSVFLRRKKFTTRVRVIPGHPSWKKKLFCYAPPKKHPRCSSQQTALEAGGTAAAATRLALQLILIAEFGLHLLRSSIHHTRGAGMRWPVAGSPEHLQILCQACCLSRGSCMVMGAVLILQVS